MSVQPVFEAASILGRTPPELTHPVFGARLRHPRGPLPAEVQRVVDEARALVAASAAVPARVSPRSVDSDPAPSGLGGDPAPSGLGGDPAPSGLGGDPVDQVRSNLVSALRLARGEVTRRELPSRLAATSVSVVAWASDILSNSAWTLDVTVTVVGQDAVGARDAGWPPPAGAITVTGSSGAVLATASLSRGSCRLRVLASLAAEALTVHYSGDLHHGGAALSWSPPA